MNFQTNVRCLSNFEPTTADEVAQIVSSYGIKCSPDDPVPTNVLKSNWELFVPTWVELINISLEQGSMDFLKSAVVVPLIKDMNNFMDCEARKNYRPVSNLQFLAKLIERVVSIRLKKHMADNDLLMDEQYGYKKFHSTETLLLKVINDLQIACDEQRPTIVLLLDLSAAFDTVDQLKLIAILRNEIGIVGPALDWFKSFLTDRSQRVMIGDSSSTVTKLLFGVPQGSVLACDLFGIYIRPLYPHIQPSKFDIFGFADDHQLLKTFLPILQVQALDNDINRCFEMISDWMQEYFLCLNPSKTKILVVKPPSLKNEIEIGGTFIGGNCVRFVTSAKNLGIILDDELSFEHQVTAVVKSCFVTIRKISKVKSFLSVDQLKTLVTSCVFSKLDYCNSIYYGMSTRLLLKLQSVQNSAARLIKSKINLAYIPTSVYIRDLHWLPMKERIVFKVLFIVHKCLNGFAPASLADLFEYSTSDRTCKLVHRRSKRSYGKKAFSRCGPRLWNLLPIDIRLESITEEFKKQLKTFFFKNPGFFLCCE